ncbi:schlafen family member 11 [Amia ocellicauda]|uniref:schlafen family member 11 n=1 Tax=Amia ocellicauda TaxID=2972642 RepID=UPI0034642EBF|nr:SLN13 protein [Amia calva]
MNPLQLEENGYPDQVINIGQIILGEIARKRMQAKDREVQKRRVLQAACALLNSGGGLILAKSKNTEYKYHDGLGGDIEKALRELIFPSSLQDYFEYLQQGIHLIVFVKSWCADNTQARICSIDTSLYRRSGTSTEKVAPSAFSELQKKKKHRAEKRERNQQPAVKRPNIEHRSVDEIGASVEQFCKKQQVGLGEKLTFGETANVEFKSCKGTKLSKWLERDLRRYISGFKNADGGFLIFGVDDQTKEIVGCGNNEAKHCIQDKVQAMFEKTVSVHFDHCDSQKMVPPAVFFIDVLDAEDLYVLVIEIQPSCCVVFSKCPDSWVIEDQTMKELEAAVWLEKMSCTDQEITGLCSSFTKELSISAAPPQCKPVYSFNQHSLEALQNALCPVGSEGIKVTPESITKDLFEKFPGLEGLKDAEGHHGALIFSYSWAVDLDTPKNESIICDALLISSDRHPIFYTIVRKETPDSWKYARETAFLLKQKLVNVGGYSEKTCVIPKLVDCNTGGIIPRVNNPVDSEQILVNYPDGYILRDITSVKALLRALVIVLLSFSSFLSDQLGSKFLNLLTIQQFEVLNYKYCFQDFKRLFVHGLPGTGKTVIAMNLMKRIKNTYNCEIKNILYICENQLLRDFMWRQNICQCTTRKSFMSPYNDFAEAEHIIVDEAQNFRQEDGDWYKKAEGIMERGENNGVFWIFVDYFQKSHTEADGLPDVFRQNHVILTVCVRNSFRIYNEVSNLIKEISSGTIGRQYRGSMKEHLEKITRNSVCSHSFQGTYRKQKVKEIVPFIVMSVNTLFSKGFLPRDIAILLSNNQELEDFRRRLLQHSDKSLLCKFATESDAHEDLIVVETIRRFSGLERNIVYVLNPKTHYWQLNIQPNLLVSAISRARTQLYLVYSTSE